MSPPLTVYGASESRPSSSRCILLDESHFTGRSTYLRTVRTTLTRSMDVCVAPCSNDPTQRSKLRCVWGMLSPFFVGRNGLLDDFHLDPKDGCVLGD
jgi:hypothetical protein